MQLLFLLHVLIWNNSQANVQDAVIQDIYVTNEKRAFLC